MATFKSNFMIVFMVTFISSSVGNTSENNSNTTGENNGNTTAPGQKFIPGRRSEAVPSATAPGPAAFRPKFGAGGRSEYQTGGLSRTPSATGSFKSVPIKMIDATPASSSDTDSSSKSSSAKSTFSPARTSSGPTTTVPVKTTDPTPASSSATDPTSASNSIGAGASDSDAAKSAFSLSRNKSGNKSVSFTLSTDPTSASNSKPTTTVPVKTTDPTPASSSGGEDTAVSSTSTAATTNAPAPRIDTTTTVPAKITDPTLASGSATGPISSSRSATYPTSASNSGPTTTVPVKTSDPTSASNSFGAGASDSDAESMETDNRPVKRNVYSNADGSGYILYAYDNRDGTFTEIKRESLTAEQLKEYVASEENISDQQELSEEKYQKENTYNRCLTEVQKYGFKMTETALQSLINAFFNMTLENFVERCITDFSKGYFFHLIEGVSLNFSEVEDPLTWCTVQGENEKSVESCQYNLFNSNIYGLSLKSVIQNFYYNFAVSLYDLTNEWVLKYFDHVSKGVKFSSFRLLNLDDYCKIRTKVNLVLENIERKSLTT